MIFAIDLGHNVNTDGGAVGIRKENDLIMEVGEKVIHRLRKAGHQVVECKPLWASSVRDSLSRRVHIANKSEADVFASIHFNAFNGQAHGSEVFAISWKGRQIGQKVLNNIVDLGFTNRGVKSKNFYVLRATRMPAILIECCFVDNWRDINRFNADKMAAAIANGLMH